MLFGSTTFSEVPLSTIAGGDVAVDVSAAANLVAIAILTGNLSEYVSDFVGRVWNVPACDVEWIIAACGSEWILAECGSEWNITDD